jgi:hypothetical protein
MNTIENRVIRIKNNIINIPKIYWINLDESIDRNIYLSTLLNTYKIDNKRIKAVNGKRGEHLRILLEYNSKSGTDSEYGCTLSHILALLEFYISGEDRCIIAEDDLSFDTVEYWNFSWKDFENNLPDDYEIVQLSRNTTDHNRQLYNGYTRSTLCYLVKRKFAEKILTKLYDKNINKINLKGYENIAADNFIYIFGKCYSFPLFIFRLYKSTISNDMDKIMRIIYDYNINLWRPKSFKEINNIKKISTNGNKMKEIYKRKY